uniref:DnaJ heat shock protein family (Hsp40) member B12 n=1 Tax=Sciurus vulgaris TaxID=55149 RepID=A0A8D2DF95_SCIVU
MIRTKQPDTATGMGTSTVALRLTSPLKTSSTCSLVVASLLVSSLPFPQPGLPGSDGGRLDPPLPFPAAPASDSVPLTSGNVHVYSNGRMRYTYQQRQDRRENQGDGGLGVFVQLMPILILILVSALSQLMVSSPPYSLSPRPSVGHVHRRVTEHLSVVYYVADTFSEEYTGSSLKTVERNVEDDYIANLRNNCWKEKQQKEGLLYRARYFGDTDMYHRAQKMGTPSCSRLSETMKSLENFW